MTFWLDKLTDIVALRGDQDIIKSALAEVTAQCEFSGYAYFHLQASRVFAVSNYDPDWLNLYFSKNYHAVDPILKRARSAKCAFSWSADLRQPGLSKKERKFLEQSAQYGIRAGITIPVKTSNGSVAVFTLASRDQSPELREIDKIAAAAVVGQLHALISFVRITPSAMSNIWLDLKEAIYLNWIAEGKTMEEVAAIEGVKYNSVRVKLETARKRLDVNTTTQLTAVAIRANLI